jgi:type IV pilus assembly protein PilO
MPDLRQTRRKMKIAFGVMLGLDIVAAAVLFSPLVGSAESRRQELTELWAELKMKTAQVEPLKDMDKRIKVANQQITDFYDKRFPSEQSQIATELGKLKDANGVTIDRAKYKTGDVGPGRLQPVEIEMDLAGNYVALAKFINSVERDDMFFLINSITLGSEQAGGVKLQLKLDAYVKAGA